MIDPGRVWRVSSGLVADTAGAARGRTSRASTYVAVRRLHEQTGGRSSVILHGMYRRLPGWADRIDAGRLAELERTHAVPRAGLLDEGVVALDPVFTADQVAALRSFAETAPGRATVDGRMTVCTYRDRPEGVAGIIIDRDFLWARREVQALLASTMPTELAMACFGGGAIAHFPTLVWSLPSGSADGAVERRMLARRFHADYDGLRGLRLHVYLNDVDDGAAPMQYIRGSHRAGALPGSLIRRYGDDLPEEVVLDRFGRDRLVSMTGAAGTTFATISQGLHRATAAVSGERLCLILPIQVGALAGAYLRPREVPVIDDQFAAALAAGRSDLRLYRAGAAVPAGRARLASLA